MAFLKCSKEILKDLNIDIYESILLCLYIEKYTTYGRVIVSDSKDAEYLKIDRKYVGKKRKHLEKLGYIECVSTKGKPTELRINRKLLENGQS